MVAPLFALAEERGASGLRLVLAYVAGIEAGLDPPRMATALALAASMASGLKANFGTMAKPFHVGHCARNGLLDALMAEQGFEARHTGCWSTARADLVAWIR
jgi:2-methylcitrate dehydratase PrpD